MKTRQINYKRWFTALTLIAAGGMVFGMGWYAAGVYEEQRAYAALWKEMESVPEPEQCALCGKGMRYHAPCLIDLSTGQMEEMKVYTNYPTKQGELASAELQETGTFQFQPCAGLVGVRDTCNHTCEVTLPKGRRQINMSLFCKGCRLLLHQTWLDGYAIVDLYDLDDVRVYPVQNNTIRDYCISVTKGKEGTLRVYVEGLL